MQTVVDEHGLLLRRTALALGFDDNWLHRMTRSGVLVRIRHGAYADAQVWRQLDRVGRHLLLCRSVMRQYDDRVALSHASAHLLRGGPDWGLAFDTVNITNLFGRGDRQQSGITHHRGTTGVLDVSRINGHWLTSPPRTAVETAAAAALVPAVSVLDWSLHHRHATREELEAYAHVHMREWPDTVTLPTAVALSDGRSESVGETRTRIALVNQGFDPEPQWEVFHPSGRLAGRVDMRLRKEGVMVEFDGRIKYGRLLKSGQTVADVIKKERAREVLLEELTGLRMLRVIWSDLNDERALAERVHRIWARRRAA